jgi:SPP1 gp7 family putative phage head morphogenesis protein
MNWKPALEADARLAAKNALKIRAAIAQSFDSKRVLLQYQQTQPIVTKNPTQDRARARAWAVMNINPNMQPLKEVMLKVWAEGYVTGEAFADEQIKFAREISKADDDGFVDWKNWRPGDKATALILQQPDGFKKLLASQGLTFKDFSNKTLFDIGDALAGAIELGLSPQRAAKQIQQHVANPARALSIAITEQNRAMSYATVNRFQDAGLEKMEWEVSSPCAVCAQNANQVVTIGQSFKSGVTQPPQHPHCRCVLLPVIPDYAEEGAMPGAVVVTPPPAPVVPAERLIASGSDVFVPGAWTMLSKEEIREGIIDRYVAALPQKTRNEIAVYVDDLRIATPDKALMKSGVVYKNGPIQVNFYSTGAKLPEKNKQKVIDTIEKLQVMNPKKKVTINIGQESSSKYGWALLGGERLWITPKTARSIIPDPSEVGFKMPVLGQVSRLEYTLAHEWGHLIDEGGGFAKSGVSFQAQKTTDVINEAKRQFPDAFVSNYSLENSKEFYAEMFTEFFNSRGLTDNPLVQYMAKELGWKAPGVRATPVAGYTKAKNPPAYYLDDVEAAEARLKGYIPTKIREKDGAVVLDWSAASGGTGPENIQLKNLMREQGFLGKPRIVTADEFQKVIDQGATPIYRGMGAKTQEQVDEYAQRLLAGDDPYIGRGFFGDGTYFASDRGIAERFAAQDVTGEIDFKFGEVLEGVLDPQAKVIDVEDLWKLRNDYVENMPYHGELAQMYEDDIGLFATTQGYDAIVNKNPMIGYTSDGQRRYAPGSYYTILNRSALIMKGKP